jgi:outer membrane protein assembly factor BamB
VIAAALVALALVTPHVAWTARLSAPVGTPTVADGHIYVATGTNHTRLHALDAATGKRQWQAIGGLGTSYAPLAAPGLVLRLSNADTVRRYDPATGRIFWRRDHPYAEGFLAPPLLAAGRVFELSDSLVALDAHTGALLWRADDDCFRCRVASDGSRVYAAGKGGMRAFDAATGKVVWHTRGFAGLGVASSAVLANGTVAAVETQVNGKVWSFFLEAFRATDGKSLWHTKLGDASGFDPVAAPVTDGALLLYNAPDGNLYALDLTTGSIRWHIAVGDTDSIPAIGNNLVWLVDTAGRLHSFDAATGASVWMSAAMKVKANFSYASPVIDGDLVLVGTAAGNLLAFSQN